MGGGILIHPVFFFVGHPTAARDFARGAGFVGWAGEGAVAKRLGPVSTLAGIPMVDDHLHRHPAAPDAGGASAVVGSRGQPAVPAFSVHGKHRRNSSVGWWWCGRGLSLYAFSDFELAHLVEFDDLQTWVGDPQSFSADGVSNPELMFGLRAFADSDEEITVVTANASIHAENVPLISMTSFVKGPHQPNPGLNRSSDSTPWDFF